MIKVFFILFCIFFSSLSFAQTSKLSHLKNETPEILKNSSIQAKLGENIFKETFVFDHYGTKRPFKSFFEGRKPIVFSIVYYECPSLCNFHLNGLIDTFKKMKMTAGEDFKFIALSMNPKEDHRLASLKRQSYLKHYNRGDVEDFYFLTASKKSIKHIADSVGFYFNWDKATQQYAHSSAAIILTSQGKISKYLNGILFDVQTLKLSLVEASKGTIGTPLDQFLLYCFQFNPKTSKYTLYTYNIIRGSGVLTVVLLIFFLGPRWLYEFRKRKKKV